MANRIANAFSQFPDDDIGAAPTFAPDSKIEPLAPTFAPDSKIEPLDTSWSDVASQAISNAPQSAANFVGDIYNAVRHPITTVENIGDLARGLAEKQKHLYQTELGVPAETGEHEQYADQAIKFFSDRYGGVDQFKHALATDPVGVAGDLSTLLSGGETMAARLGPVAKAAGVARAVTDPLSWVSGAVRGAGTGLKELAGVQSGVGRAPLEQAYLAGLEGGDKAQAFRENITGNADMTDVLADAKAGLEQMRRERGAAYRQQMDAMRAQDDALGIENQILDFGKIDDAVDAANEVQTYRGRSGAGPAIRLDPGADAVRSEMMDQIDAWKQLPPTEYHTAEGIDALKRQLGNTMRGTAPGTPARFAAGNIYDAVKQTIVDQAPEYAKIMEGYEQASKQLKEIETTLSLNPKANVDTALRKLQSVLRDNVNTNYGRRAQLADYLVNAGAPNLLAKLAGQSLAPLAPRGIARLATAEAVPAIAGAIGGLGAGALAAGLSALATLPMSSPRIVGETAYGLGAANRRLRQIPGAIPIATTVARSLRPARAIGRITEPFGNP